MSARKTWIWIVVGCLGTGVVGLMAVAGAGVYFVAQHIQSERSTAADALGAFDGAATRFRDQRPLYELDGADEPRLVRPLRTLPTGGAQADALCILAWDPDGERLVRASLPFWLLSVGHGKMRVAGAESGFDLNRLNLDPDQLRRIGPALVFDFRGREGGRVLLWTQ